VAMLAPTTILSMQHYHVLTQRFSEYPFRVEVLNRYAGSEKRNQVLTDLEAGKVDVLIGTHSILSDAVKFKKLGLLVIDEEQKFGVVQKEKLKKKKLDVHTLSMTATPIPRTLNMAISGIRDLSILSSVPMGRKPIENHFGEFDWDVALKAIDVEVRRGGTGLLPA
jgi:transcription-repair coupling factor (superfamily II helicase)